jgi:hypothetical protein
MLNLDLGTFAAIGLVSALAGSANTPIAASIMAVELFGPQIAPYATVACVISFLITGHRSVYPSQVLSISKSPSLKVEIGKELEEINVSYQPRKKSLASILLHFIDAIEKLVRKIQSDLTSGNHSSDSDKASK